MSSTFKVQGSRLAAVCAFACFMWPGRSFAESTPDFGAVHAIFEKHCLDCHESKDPEANLVLDTYDALMKGGESGPAIVSGKSSESLLMQMVEGRLEKDGKK